jgi:hypothetical protein
MTEINSTYADALFDNLTAGTAVPSGDRFLALATDGSFTEAAGGSYARQDITAVMDTPTDGDATNTTAVTFTGLASDTYSHWVLWDDVTAGDWLVRGAFPFPQIVGGGGTVTVDIGDLSVAIDAVP